MASQYTKNFNTKLAVHVALLHDVLEETETTCKELLLIYGDQVTNAVSALTKNTILPKEEQMADSDYSDPIIASDSGRIGATFLELNLRQKKVNPEVFRPDIPAESATPSKADL